MRTFSVKNTFKLILLMLVVVLTMLPFATAFNEFLTRVVEDLALYRHIQRIFVPYVSSIVVGILRYLPGLEVGTYPYGVVINGVDVRITWNCLGWQSFLLFFTSLIVGLRGPYTRLSRGEAVLFGVLGTFLINVFRLVFTAALVGWWRGLFLILFHNYFFTFTAILWLFVFWWFVYSFVLTEREPIVEDKATKV